MKRNGCFMLFESGFFDGSNSKSYILTNPVDTIKVNRYRDVENAFKKIEEYSRKYYLAGYFSYELGYYFEKSSFKTKNIFPYPLIHLCAFKKITAFDHRTGGDFRVDNLRLGFTRSEYLRKISRIKRHVMNGDTYQANFTGKYLFDFSGDAFSFYRDLRERQNVPYGAFCKFGEKYVISLSPELFFRRDGGAICSRPMKGTIERGRDIREDKGKVSGLKKSAKEAAGNLMIVDLIRNDLGKISETGSVGVSSLFEIERYDTLFQMTSTIKSTLKAGTTYFDIFRSLFPGGSVTGAPKIRTMQILKEVEDDDRNIYCGALGIIFPGKKAVFNLPIRTISIADGKAEMGVGGGITSDSDAEEEYRECLLKAKFLTERYRPFSLIETMRWEGRFKSLKEHLKRMRDSAEYFGFTFDRRKITAALEGDAKGFVKGLSYRVRLLLSKDGGVGVESSEIAPGINPDFSLEKSAPSDSEGLHDQTRREFGQFCPDEFEEFLRTSPGQSFQIGQGRVSQILQLHKIVRSKNPGLPRKIGKSDEDLPNDPFGANFAITKFGIRPGIGSAAVSRKRTDPGDLFLYHKTTNRGLYDSEYRRYRAKGYFDVIFLNTKGEVCEGAISNVIIKKGGRFYTPPLSSGLLPGIFRGRLLKERRVKEKALLLKDLLAADKVFLCNSVRGLIEVKVSRSPNDC